MSRVLSLLLVGSAAAAAALSLLLSPGSCNFYANGFEMKHTTTAALNGNSYHHHDHRNPHGYYYLENGHFSSSLIGYHHPLVGRASSSSSLFMASSSSSSSDKDVNIEEELGGDLKDEEEDEEEMETSKKNKKETTTTTMTKGLRLLPGLSGFACNEDIHGFVALISCRYSPNYVSDNDTDDNDDNDMSRSSRRIVPIMVTSTDRADSISSPEALCLIQLAAGLDLGTAIFPPDTLKDLIIEELMEDDIDDDDDDHENNNKDELQLQSLQYNILGTLQINQIKPPTTPKEEEEETKKDDTTTDTIVADSSSPKDDDVVSSSSSKRRIIQDGDEKDLIVTMEDYFEDPEREEKLQKNAKKMLSVIQNLPGLMDVTATHLYQAMTQVADADGNVTTRQSFSEMLNLLRQRHLDKQRQQQQQSSQQIIQPQDPLIQFLIPIQKLIDPIFVSKNYSSPSSSSSSFNNNNNNNDANNSGESSSTSSSNQTNCHCNVDIPSPFIALALSMRYNLQIEIKDNVISKYGIDESELLNKYPTFRSLQEIQQESQEARGFLSSSPFHSKKNPSSSSDNDNNNNSNFDTNDAFQ